MRKGKRYGPYAWDELSSHAASGRIHARDQVFSPSTQVWTKASRLQGLIGSNGKPLRSYAWLGAGSTIVAITAALAAVIIFAPVQWPWDTVTTGDIGAYSYSPPIGPVVVTETWGPTPANRVCILLDEDAERAKAEAVASTLGATIAGEIETIGLFVLQTAGTTEADLLAALDTAARAPGVQSAFPEEPATLAITRQGWRCEDGGKLEDPAYEGTNGTSYQMIGAQNAWDLIKANGATLGSVQVGIVDDGLYDSGEFDGGSVRFTSGQAEDTLAQPLDDESGAQLGYYSHGTGVASVIAADDDDGGIVGIASVLEDHLTVHSTNFEASRYADDWEAEMDPDDPTVYSDASGTWANGSLVALMDQVKSGSTIINCSWGADLSTGPPDAGTVAAYRRFFEWMHANRPEVLFVCAAGNDGIAPGKDGMWPAGVASPNVVTVGNVDGSGKVGATSSNLASDGFEVTLAAPGEGVPYGIAADGVVVARGGGTSMAAPQVAAVAALLRAIDPDLDAADIKDILAETSRTEIGGSTVEAGVGGRVLAADQAVLWVLNLQRTANGESPLTMEAALGGSRIDLEATYEEPSADDSNAKGSWRVVATVPRVGPAGVTLVARYTGNETVDGDLTVTLPAAGSAEWTIPGDSAGVFHVLRQDSNVCWRVQLGSATAGNTGAAGEGSGNTTASQTPGVQSFGAPVGDAALVDAITAAFDDAGASLLRIENPSQTGYDYLWRAWSREGSERAHVTVNVTDSPEQAIDWTDRAWTVEDTAWDFHELIAFQSFRHWGEPTSRTYWWAQGRYKIVVEWFGPRPTGFEELPEALWRRFGGETGPGTPTRGPQGAEMTNAGVDELPFGTKADLSTGY